MRRVLVTLGIALAGGFFGMASTVTAVGAVLLVDGWLRVFVGFQMVVAAGMAGAVLGSALAPAAAWALLRRVPLPRAFAGMSLGAIAGGVAGVFIQPVMHPLLQPVAFATGGLALAALLMRRRHARLARVPAASLDGLVRGGKGRRP
jgi:hypothetical protein